MVDWSGDRPTGIPLQCVNLTLTASLPRGTWLGKHSSCKQPLTSKRKSLTTLPANALQLRHYKHWGIYKLMSHKWGKQQNFVTVGTRLSPEDKAELQRKHPTEGEVSKVLRALIRKYLDGRIIGLKLET